MRYVYYEVGMEGNMAGKRKAGKRLFTVLMAAAVCLSTVNTGTSQNVRANDDTVESTA